MSQRIVTRNTRWNKLRTHATKASVWSTLFIGRAGQIQTAHGSLSPTWAMQAMWFMISMQLILLLHAICGVFLPLTSFSYSTIHGFHAAHPSAPCHLWSISPFNFLQLFHYVRSLPPVTSLTLFDHLEVDL